MDEAILMEDKLSKEDEVNAKIGKGEVNPKDLIVGSLVVQALYSNIDVKTAGIIGRDTIMASNL